MLERSGQRLRLGHARENLARPRDATLLCVQLPEREQRGGLLAALVPKRAQTRQVLGGAVEQLAVALRVDLAGGDRNHIGLARLVHVDDHARQGARATHQASEKLLRRA
jgi:hypothetical protein